MNKTQIHKQLLVMRFSAMGDVALTVPVIKHLLEQEREIRIILVTRQAFVPFFNGIANLDVKPADFKNAHRGIWGLFRLFREIQSEYRIDGIIDLHDVIRSRVISLLFGLKGIKTSRIRKDRREKKAIIQGAELKELKHTTRRYMEAFHGHLPKEVEPQVHHLIPDPSGSKGAQDFIEESHVSGNTLWIGLAPMAKHKLKMWELDNFQRLIEIISEIQPVSFFLFGGGEEEKLKLDELAERHSNVYNVTGRLKMSEEMQLISRLRFMITMDSGNMHLSALLGIPTISIWGGTHPFLGFSPLYQPDDHFIQIPKEELTCRPCTVYGKGECHRGDLACLRWIKPEMVVERIKKLGLLKSS